MKTLALLLLPLACSTTVVNHGGSSDDAGTVDGGDTDLRGSDVNIEPETGSEQADGKAAGNGGHGSVDSGSGGGGGGQKKPPEEAGGRAGAAGGSDAGPEATDAGSEAPGSPEAAPSDAASIPDGWLTLADGYAYPPPPDGGYWPVGCPATYRCVEGDLMGGACGGAQDKYGIVGAPCCLSLCTCGADWGGGCEKVVVCPVEPTNPHCLG